MAALTLSQLWVVAAPGTVQAQELTKEEADAYRAYYDAQSAKDWTRALDAAKAYVQKFPSGKYTKYLKDRGIPQARGVLFNAAIAAKNTSEMIRLGKEALADDPQNLDYLYLLALKIRELELFASPPNYSHAADAVGFTNRAIALIEGGKAPTMVQADKWNQKSNLSWLYQNLAVIEANNKNTDKAIENYSKAAELDPTNAFNFLACGSLHQAKYAEAVKKYQAIPEEDRAVAEADMKPEVKDALGTVNKEADAVINCWARFMAVTMNSKDYEQQRSQVEKVLPDLYKYRHPDAPPDGLQKLIEQLRNNPPS
jgi:lipopolysaccharide biosynthesis regulator YciM